jgi:hypothetical protein
VRSTRHRRHQRNAGKLLASANRRSAPATREKAEIKAAISQAETIQQFWAESLKVADPEKLTVWKARQEEVEGQLGAMRLEGRAYDDQFIDDVDRDTNDMLREFGEAAATPVLLVGKFWQDPELLGQLTKNENATAIFAKFGILVALPDMRVHQWTEFVRSRRSAAIFGEVES